MLGATGFIGSALCARLAERGDGVVVTSRYPEEARRKLPAAEVLPTAPQDAASLAMAVARVDAVVNLAGDPLDQGRWSDAKKARIRDSRVLGTRLLARAFDMAERKPAVLVQGSAVGVYGPRDDTPLDESADLGPDGDFLASVCRVWEQEARAVEAHARVVMLRTGVVLASGGRAFTKMVLPFRLFAGGPIGTGRQWLSWIHRHDLVALILHAIDRSDVRGPLNGTAPEPVTSRDLARTIGRVLHRPSFMPMPAFALRLAVGEMAEVLLAGQRVVPRKALDTGFAFRFATLEAALRAILGG